MKSILAVFGLVLLVLAIESMASGASIVSDPSSDNATSCQFESFQLPCSLDATKAIRVDLATLPAGTYSVRAQFCNSLFCSDWSNTLTFTTTKPVSPKNLRLSR